ncbi:MAG: hypothetical protein M5U09_13265 [Gammaproteobacteria bacterium]|nr:hypothetical protein [Gammaproteobacteria bacterium]
MPERLTANPPLRSISCAPFIRLFSQTCGYPLTHALAGLVRLVATPCHAAPGCDGPRYRSLLIVAAESRAETLDGLRSMRCAFNDTDSSPAAMS